MSSFFTATIKFEKSVSLVACLIKARLLEVNHRTQRDRDPEMTLKYKQEESGQSI